ncbi:MAG: hypothetical protein A3H94_08600 [Acidobacteria bacterium RIFCSPLOWO2_02_FULL_60_20]|nr:MAG: hypothetical protein A3H94_08600 [Acidobacteria bacterium RIFCSPLOWO2_02_FULL_60_20]
MNCHEFASIVVDLTQPQTAWNCPKISAALSHAENCTDCSERLSGQRSLARQLHELARSAVVREASPQREAALRAAFRERYGSSIEVADLPAPRGGWKPWVIAIAAMLLVTVAGFIALQKLPGRRPSEPSVPVATGTSPQAAVTTADPIPAPAATATRKQSEPEVTPSMAARGNEDRAPISPPIAAQPVSVSEPAIAASARYETTSEFVPLLYGGDPMLMDWGPVVRVEVTGAVLQSLGFPIAGEPSTRRIQADLMLGQDGLARAIRFVQ